ncbi:MAG: hypothetical protein OXR84_01585 [Magnetovibrio sp.]|nr:hypothetical protein [Magnetovibrio sp.]
MALFGRKKKKKAPIGPPQDPKWVHGEGGRFPKFFDLDPEAAGLFSKSAVFAIWHTGVQPGWVFIGRSDNLAETFFELGEDDEVLAYQNRGSMFVSWCYIRDEFQDGAVAYLTAALKPKVDNPRAKTEDEVEFVPVYPPGMAPKTDENRGANGGA